MASSARGTRRLAATLLVVLLAAVPPAAAAVRPPSACAVVACVAPPPEPGVGACVHGFVGWGVYLVMTEVAACGSTDPARRGAIAQRASASVFVWRLPETAYFDNEGLYCVPVTSAEAREDGITGPPTAEAGAYRGTWCSGFGWYTMEREETIAAVGLCDTDRNGHGDTPCGTLP